MSSIEKNKAPQQNHSCKEIIRTVMMIDGVERL